MNVHLANLKDVKPFAKTRKKNKKGLKINSIKADENVKTSKATVSKAKHSKKFSKGQSHDRQALKVMKKKDGSTIKKKILYQN